MANNEDCKPTPTLLKRTKIRARKPKVVSEWSDNEVFKLIACVREQPGLWDTRDSQYRKKHQRTKLWNEMSANEFDSKFEGTELLAKWSNVRIQFRSYANKKSKSGHGQTAPRIYWKFFKAMQFVGNLENEKTARTTESNLSFEDSDSSLRIVPATRITRKRRVSVSNEANEASTHSVTLVAESMKAAIESLNQSKKEPQPSDEFEAFGKFLASELRSLNTAMARRIKHRLNRYFLDVVEEEQRRVPSYCVKIE